MMYFFRLLLLLLLLLSLLNQSLNFHLTFTLNIIFYIPVFIFKFRQMEDNYNLLEAFFIHWNVTKYEVSLFFSVALSRACIPFSSPVSSCEGYVIIKRITGSFSISRFNVHTTLFLWGRWNNVVCVQGKLPMIQSVFIQGSENQLFNKLNPRYKTKCFEKPFSGSIYRVTIYCINFYLICWIK